MILVQTPTNSIIGRVGYDVDRWSQVDECVPVGACSDLGIDSQLLHHGVRHEGEKGGNDCCWDLCLICCVLFWFYTGTHAADLQNLLIVLPIYPAILVYSTIRVLF